MDSQPTPSQGAVTLPEYAAPEWLNSAGASQRGFFITRQGASANVLARLPRREYRGTTMTTRVCAVCLETFVDGEVVKRASSTCSHEFHDACIDAWLARRDCCPMCRTRAEAPTGRVEFEID